MPLNSADAQGTAKHRPAPAGSNPATTQSRALLGGLSLAGNKLSIRATLYIWVTGSPVQRGGGHFMGASMRETEDWVATDAQGYVVLMMCVTGYTEAVKQLIASLGIRAMDKYYLRRFRTGDQIGIQNG